MLGGPNFSAQNGDYIIMLNVWSIIKGEFGWPCFLRLKLPLFTKVRKQRCPSKGPILFFFFPTIWFTDQSFPIDLGDLNIIKYYIDKIPCKEVDNEYTHPCPQGFLCEYTNYFAVVCGKLSTLSPGFKTKNPRDEGGKLSLPRSKYDNFEDEKIVNFASWNANFNYVV